MKSFKWKLDLKLNYWVSNMSCMLIQYLYLWYVKLEIQQGQ